MRRGPTPNYVLTIPGYDLTGCELYVSLEQYATLVTITNDRLECTYDQVKDESSIVFSLTQDETLAFKSGAAEIQVRFIDRDGEVQATEVKNIRVHPVLFEGVISYGESAGN